MTATITNQITFAKRGNFINRNNEKILVLHNGKTITTNDKQVSNIQFEKTDFNISKFTTKTTTVLKTQENSTIKLFNCAIKLSKDKKNLGESYGFFNCRIDNKKNITQELYKRLILPTYFPIFILTTLMLVIKSKENNKFNNYKFIVFLAGILFLIFSEISIKFISSNLKDNIINLLIPFLIFFILYSIFCNQVKFKK